MNDPARILIVDDNEINRSVLNDLITTLGHTPILAENGLLALASMEEQASDIVLLDILMPEMDGYETLEHLKSNNDYRHIPVIMISALDDMDGIVRCIEKGADDYLTKPFNPILLKARIGACLEKKRLLDQGEKYKSEIENYNMDLQRRVWDQVQEITTTQLATIFAMANLAESRDPETGEHLERIREYVKALSEELSLMPKYASIIDKSFIDSLYNASPLHDIGKVGIPDRILLKPGKFTVEEFNIMKAHTTIGAKTLREVDRQHPGNEFVRVGIEIAENHHEKWDGTGYPNGLTGDDIPLAGRIVALADVYDALISKRVYKEIFSHAWARETIRDGSGKHFDPDVVDTFVSIEETFISIKNRYIDSEKELIS